MKQSLQNFFKNETVVAILLILLTTVVTYGVSIPRLGYYHDDWFVLWSGQARGGASIAPLFSTDRPYMGVIYSYVYRLLGDTIINWHLYALLWRFLGGLAFFWILRLIWPNQKYMTTLMTVLFIVYPGFLSQPNANTKQNQLYGFGTALLSIALMLQALKTNRRGWKIFCSLFSYLLTANYLFIYEYMIGFEGTRLILLGYVLYQEGFKDIRSLAREIVKRAWPYWLVTAGFLYWRIFIFEGSRNATDVSGLAGSYLGNFRYMSIRLVIETAKDFLDTSVFAWFVEPYQLFSLAPYSNLGLAVLIAGIVVAMVLFYMFLFKKWWGAKYSEETPRLMKDFIWMGALIILCAVAPVILSDRQVDLYDPYKSYGLHPIPGVVLLVAGILFMFQPNFRRLILIALVGISVSTQILNADYWADYWNVQRGMWWQMTWRAPDIQADTLVMAYISGGYNPQQDYEVWGPLNLIYNPNPAKAPAIQAEVLNSDTSYSILEKEVRNNHVRDIRLHRDFNNVLLLSMPSSVSCMHVIDGQLPVYSAGESLLVEKVGAYSHIDRIISTGTAPVPPRSIFGNEPAHDWCYYYQKASLARQSGKWKEIGKLYDEVRKLNLDTDDKSELIPFFEGLVNSGRYEDAKALYKEEIKGQNEVRFPLCTFLAKDPGYPPAFGYDYQKVYELLCKS
jgi:hypothetical protein